jgi:hypothetical protein
MDNELGEVMGTLIIGLITLWLVLSAGGTMLRSTRCNAPKLNIERVLTTRALCPIGE